MRGESRTTMWRRRKGLMPRTLSAGTSIEIENNGAFHRIGRRYFQFLYEYAEEDINQTIEELKLSYPKIRDWCELSRITYRHLYALARELGWRKTKGGWHQS